MSMEGQSFYPGERATAAQLLALAAEYRRSAEMLLAAGRSGSPLSWAPYRLVAIHAIELYLNAYLLSAGYRAAEIRALQHDVAARSRLTIVASLKLRKRTSAHLQSLSSNREYLVTRYDPAPAANSNLNRLHATLVELSEKVCGSIVAKAAADK